MTVLRRQKTGRCAVPGYGIIDAQSVKTQYASEERGIDGGKKVKGHKRHIVVDIPGNLLPVKVHAANMSATKSAGMVLAGVIDKYPSLKAFSEPVQSLCSNNAKKARWTNCRLVLSLRSQFFHSRRHFSNHAKERSTTRRFGITENMCN